MTGKEEVEELGAPRPYRATSVPPFYDEISRHYTMNMGGKRTGEYEKFSSAFFFQI